MIAKIQHTYSLLTLIRSQLTRKGSAGLSLSCGLALAAVLLLTPRAQASLANLEALQSANANLLDQYTFEGTSDATRLADTGSAANDLVRAAGADGGDVNNIQFVTGFDGVSQAYQPSFVARRNGAGLVSTGTTTLPASITAEAVFQLDTFVPETSGDVSYLFSARSSAGRAYFMLQAADPTSRVTTTFGDTFSDRPAVLDYVPGDWYYMAVVAQYDSGANATTVDVYGADLSANEAMLTHLLSDSTTFQGDWTGDTALGVGNFNNGTQEYLQGRLDNVALTGEALSAGELQSRLDALYVAVPEPATLGLGVLAGGLLLLFRRKRQ